MKSIIHPAKLKFIFGFLLVFIMLFFSIPSEVWAQASFLPGYLLTNNKDTIKGYIDFRNNDKNSKKCSFRVNQKAEIVTYSPGEIKEYRINGGKYFISKEVKSKDSKEMYFLEYMVDGITDLYYYWNDGPHYMIEKKNGEIFELTNEEKSVITNGKEYLHKTHSYTGWLKVIFQDCPQIFSMIDKAPLENKSLIRITKKYHEYVCDDEKCIIYENTLPFLRVKFAPVISVGFSAFKLGSDQEFPANYGPKILPSAGLVLKFTFPKWNDKFALLFGNEFQTTQFKENDNPLLLNTPAIREASISSSDIKTTLAFKYTFPQGRIKPTFQVGYCNHSLLKWEVKSHAEATYNGYTRIYDYSEGPFVKSLNGVSVGPGCEFKALGNKIGFVDLLYQYTMGKYTTQGINSRVLIDNTLTCVGISGGIYF
jgi:hypothetical protein